MKNLILFLLFAPFIYFQAVAQNGTEKIKFTDHLELEVPSGFTTSHPDAPWTITWEEARVKLARTNTNLAVDDNGIPAYTDQLISELKSTKDHLKILDDGILLKNGKNIGFLSVVTESGKEKTFNYFFYLSMNEKLSLFSFSAPKKQRKTWETKAGAIANSLNLVE